MEWVDGDPQKLPGMGEVDGNARFEVLTPTLVRL